MIAPGIEEPRKLTHVYPAYPTWPSVAVSAVVIGEFEVDLRQGLVGEDPARPSIFDDAVIEAVKKWEYVPVPSRLSDGGLQFLPRSWT